jgi:flagellar FliL protein
MTVTAIPNTDEKKGGGNLRLVLIAVVLMAVLAAGVYFLFLKPKPKEAAACTPDTIGQAGCVIAKEPFTLTDPVQINLAAGHYLRIGMALLINEKAAGGEEGTTISGAPAYDAAIDLFTGLNMDDVNTSKTRDALKARLSEELMQIYPDNEVLGVLFTQFVTQ